MISPVLRPRDFGFNLPDHREHHFKSETCFRFAAVMGNALRPPRLFDDALGDLADLLPIVVAPGHAAFDPGVNLALGPRNGSGADLDRASKLAGAHELIKDALAKPGAVEYRTSS
jgi:hypothetical protein